MIVFQRKKTRLGYEIKFRGLPDWIEMLMRVIVLIRNFETWLCENCNVFRQRKKGEVVFNGNLPTRTNTERRTLVRFRWRVFAFVMQKKCLLIFNLLTRKFGCREVLARLHGQQQQIKTKNKAENSHWFELKSYYKTPVRISQKNSWRLNECVLQSEMLKIFPERIKNLVFYVLPV